MPHVAASARPLASFSGKGLADTSADPYAVLIMRATGQRVGINQQATRDTSGLVLGIAGQRESAKQSLANIQKR